MGYKLGRDCPCLDAKSKLLERYAVTDASVHDSQKLAELVGTADGEVYADSAYRSAEAEAMLAQKQVTSHIHERAYRNRPLTDEQKASNRPKSKIRARIEHVFGFMSQSLKGFYLRYIGRRRNAAAIGSLVFSALLLAAPVTRAADSPLRIAILGDSTVCDYPADKPERGWGMYIEGYFKSGSVSVLNFAMGGRSTKTFIKEGLWDKALAARPDIVLIQFGHNDSHAKERPEATDAATDYQDNLRRYADEARALGAVPIFVTPMHRRTFNADGTLNDNLKPYAAAMQRVAAEKKVPLIDLHSSSGALFAKLGEKANEEFANKSSDRTHFNEKGARAMAELVMKELPDIEPRLKVNLRIKK